MGVLRSQSAAQQADGLTKHSPAAHHFPTTLPAGTQRARTRARAQRFSGTVDCDQRCLELQVATQRAAHNWAAIRERSAPCSFAPVTWPNRTEGRLRAESLQRLAQNPCMALSALPLPGLHPAPSATQPPCQMHRAMQGRTAAQGPRRRARAWRRRRRRPCLVCSRRPRRRRGCRGRHLPRSRLRHHGPHLGQPEGPHGLRHHR